MQFFGRRRKIPLFTVSVYSVLFSSQNSQQNDKARLKLVRLTDAARYPVGTWETEQWSEARRLLQWSTTSRGADPTSIRQGLALLERCLLEHAATGQRRNEMVSRSWLLNGAAVGRLVGMWRLSSVTMSPTNLLERIGRLCELEKELSCDVRIVHRLLDAVEQTSHSSNDSRSSLSQADGIMRYAFVWSGNVDAAAFFPGVKDDLMIPSRVNPDMKPTLGTWNRYLRILSGLLRNASSADRDTLKDRMMACIHCMPHHGAAPTAATVRIVLEALATDGDYQRAEKVFSAFPAETAQCPNVPIQPTTELYNSLLNAYCQSSNPEMTTRALKTLETMRADTSIQPDFVSFISVLQCCAREGQTEEAQNALSCMLEDQAGLGSRQLSQAYSLLVEATARSGNPHEAETLLRSFVDGSKVIPAKAMVFSVMEAWALTPGYHSSAALTSMRNIDRFHRATDLLHYTLILQDKNPSLDLLSDRLFNAYLGCLLGCENITNRACLAEDIISIMTPRSLADRSSFSMAIQCCLLCGDTAGAESLLSNMYDLGLGSPDDMQLLRDLWRRCTHETTTRPVLHLAKTSPIEPGEKHLPSWELNLAIAGMLEESRWNETSSTSAFGQSGKAVNDQINDLAGLMQAGRFEKTVDPVTYSLVVSSLCQRDVDERYAEWVQMATDLVYQMHGAVLEGPVGGSELEGSIGASPREPVIAAISNKQADESSLDPSVSGGDLFAQVIEGWLKCRKPDLAWDAWHCMNSRIGEQHSDVLAMRERILSYRELVAPKSL
jgi:PPR repeat